MSIVRDFIFEMAAEVIKEVVESFQSYSTKTTGRFGPRSPECLQGVRCVRAADRGKLVLAVYSDLTQKVSELRILECTKR